MVDFISADDLKGWKRILLVITLMGGIQFLIVTILAMFFYPRPYNFFFDWFSSLGFVNANLTFKGAPFLFNGVSMVMFIVAILIVGVAIIPFFIVYQTRFKERTLTKILSRIGSTLGVVSGPFLMAVAYPADVFPLGHTVGAMGFFLIFAFTIITFSIAIFFNKEYSNLYAVVGIIVAVNAILYIFLPDLIPQLFIINAFHQKITVYSFVVWALIQISYIWGKVGQEKE